MEKNILGYIAICYLNVKHEDGIIRQVKRATGKVYVEKPDYDTLAMDAPLNNLSYGGLVPMQLIDGLIKVYESYGEEDIEPSYGFSMLQTEIDHVNEYLSLNEVSNV